MDETGNRYAKLSEELSEVNKVIAEASKVWRYHYTGLDNADSVLKTARQMKREIEEDLESLSQCVDLGEFTSISPQR
jgi:hypothetical protein